VSKKHRRVRCKKCGELFESLGKCVRCGRWLCDACFWGEGKEHIGNTCIGCDPGERRAAKPRQRKKTKPNCVIVEFKGQTVVIPLPRAKKAVDRFHELSDFQEGLVRLVLAATKESYRDHLPITIRAEQIPLTQLGQEWDGWE
jgi:hypothetical protein